MRSGLHRSVAVVVAATGLVVAGCSDDTSTSSGSTTAEGTTAPTEATSSGAEFCEEYLALIGSPSESGPEPDQIRLVAAMAPEAAKTPMEQIAAGIEESGPGYSETPDFQSQYTAANRAAADECAEARVAVTASDYQFAGIDTSLPAGLVAMELTNVGEEMHEIVLLRKKDGVGKSFDEILEAGEEGAAEFVDTTFGGFAPPGGETVSLVELQPGEYLAFCSVPVGLTPDNEEASGPPHFTEGMQVEFTVA